MVRLGDAERQAADPVYRQRLLDAAYLAQRLDDPDLLVAAALANYRGYHSSSGRVDDARVAVLEAAVDAVGRGDSPERARLLATLAVELSFSGERRHVDLGRESIEIARRTGDQQVILETIIRAGGAILVPDLYEEHERLAEEAMRLTEGLANGVATGPWAVVAPAC